jgi:hypothetical protein
MHAHKLNVTVPADHRVAVELPPDFPAGPAEIIVLSTARRGRSVVKLAGVLSGDTPAAEMAGDPVADALQELRAERAERFETFDAGAPSEAPSR